MAQITVNFRTISVGSAATFRNDINYNFNLCKTQIVNAINTLDTAVNGQNGLVSKVNTLQNTTIPALTTRVSTLEGTVNGTGSTQGLVSKVNSLQTAVDNMSGEAGAVGSWNTSVLGSIADRLGGGSNGNSGTQRRVLISYSSDRASMRTAAKDKDFIFEVYTV